MATKVFMEALSPTMEEGRLVKWLKNEGDAVKSGDVLAEVETDKAVMELVARGDGVLRKRLLAEESTAAVGSLIGVIAAADENIDALVASAGGGAAPAAGAPAPEKVVATAQETAGVSPVPRAAGEAQGEASMPPQEKAAPAPGAPQPRPGGAGARPASPAPGGDGGGSNGGRAKSSPLARRIASEQGLDI
ncbi:MAG TPA: biotin/lipoyl-containing protein, partial [Gemmatimonadaceae bacterium]|nr:biotin/lipoyl-containing protein [Gemmatimonadaceae bacterium]